MSSTYTAAEVKQHNKKDDMWLIVENNVYDITKFAPEHPGGERILQRFAGKNATKAFWKYHSENVLKKHAEKHKIGTVAEAPKL